MPMERPPAGAYAHRIPDPAAAADVAAALGHVWADLVVALSPVIGPRGTAALLQRSLHLASAAHPWLLSATPADKAALDPAPLVAQIARRDDAEASAATACLLHTFDTLLASLIGSSLTERLLRPVHSPATTPPGGLAAQDPNP